MEVEPETGALTSVGRPRLFETPRTLRQARLFALDALGEGGWLKAMRVEVYTFWTLRWLRALLDA